ncbi:MULTISPECIES: hypothetical protein [Acinetobacter]|nr:MULTISPECIES: hypothetical protein [Acinetobacter]MCL6241563.1 hypothetical protein [Acinetobacter amyesii]MCL6244522.1 hypothetical protein [Acinetobacter amyesii]UUS57498.1 hypothetical protein MST16_16035 [Acinetobacter sp. YH16040_T]
MNFYHIIIACSLLVGCNSSDREQNIDLNAVSNKNEKIYERVDFYYAFKQCNVKRNCRILKPSVLDESYFLNAYKPNNDEFFIKKNGENYEIFYKIFMIENIEMGWAKLTRLNNNENLIFNVDKIFQSYGKMNPIGGGDSFKDVESSKSKESIYYLNEYYDEYSFKQPQKIILEKQKDNTYLLDCNSYMSDLDPKNNFSGIFYRVCSEGEKIYFKII